MIVLGIDPATTLVAIADDDGRTASAPVAASDKGSQRLAEIDAKTRKLVHDFIADECPTIVFIEQPGGHVHPSLWQAFGVIRSATWIVLSTVSRFPVSVLPITPGEWKNVLLGDGAAPKSEILAWARQRGYEGASQDEADAYGIARAGYQLLRSRPGA